MLNFKPITLKNVSSFLPYFKCQNFRTCDFTIAGTFMWRKYFYTEYDIYNNMLLFKVTYINGVVAFTFPSGCGSVDEALSQLEDYAHENNIPLAFGVVPEKGLEVLKNRYRDKINVSENRDWFDYLYDKEDMQTFKGRKFHTQKNHFNKFKKLYPDYKYVPLCSDNIEKVIKFFDEFATEHEKDNPIAKEESFRTKEILPYYQRLGLFGGFIEVDNNIAAFSIGETIGDTLFVHIEKALREYEGSYQAIVKEFAAHSAGDNVKYINREEDTGDLGLRKSKLAYRPVALLKKYFVKVENNK